ncbi:hypothetical protein HanRHA438_Chr02g0094501 [Helianthus annuus]|nr:hypothetical protein HanRHA438_Chr02g0094501 [Helianthus annuus]
MFEEDKKTLQSFKYDLDDFLVQTQTNQFYCKPMMICSLPRSLHSDNKNTIGTESRCTSPQIG